MMLYALITMTVVAGILLLFGILLLLRESGTIERYDQTPEEGWVERPTGAHRPGETGLSRAAFRGHATGISSGASISLAALWQAVREGRAGEVWLWLMILGAFVAILLLVGALIWYLAGRWYGIGWYLLLAITILQNLRHGDEPDP